MPEAKKDELTIVQVESAGYNKTQVKNCYINRASSDVVLVGISALRRHEGRGRQPEVRRPSDTFGSRHTQDHTGRGTAAPGGSNLIGFIYDEH